MVRQFKPTVVLLSLFILLTGILYPFFVTSIAQVAFPSKVNGSLIDQNGDRIGSTLIGQDFSSPQYFWGRPSSTAGYPYSPFDPDALTGSSASNLGPLSQKLVDAVRLRVDALRAADPSNTLPIPIDLLTASASGLDPDISLAAAYFQAPRVARARGLNEDTVRALVDRYTANRQFGILGEPRVNVLLINLALDELK
jgi:K+-transporting ATPase ATPase C chain